MKDYPAIIKNLLLHVICRIKISLKRFLRIQFKKYFIKRYKIYKIKESYVNEVPLEWSKRHHSYHILNKYEDFFRHKKILEIGSNTGNDSILQAKKGHSIFYA